MKCKKILGLAIVATLGLELLATASETTLADTTSINSQQFSGIQYNVMIAVPSVLPTDPIVGAPGSPQTSLTISIHRDTLVMVLLLTILITLKESQERGIDIKNAIKNEDNI